MYGDATNWNEDEYRESILKEREIQTRTVFRTAWAPPERISNPDAFVVASSDGTLAFHSLNSLVSQSASFGYSKGHDVMVAEPERVVRAHDGPAYDVKFYGEDKDALLLSCGDDGRVRGWKWREFSESDVSLHLQGVCTENHVKPLLELTNPQHKGPWGALSPMPEINAMSVDPQSGSVFTAAGDSCAYCWDVESGKIKMTFKGHSDYLHTVVSRSSANQILTGSEDGTARIWDCKTGKCVKVIGSQDKKSRLRVSSMALDGSESWLVCGQGKNLALWNLPASECVSTISIPAHVQDVMFDEKQILTVGAEPVLRRFDLNGALLSQIHCAPCSVFSISLHPAGVVAVGGYGGLVDVISQFGSHLCTFRSSSL
ncbi:WD40 repeat [Arabidopsis thaliana x Arabidopsis arenosa]|uniref:WD40 repeat n=1 Tax=Arabidopsis thaliana x Arabidopsis arenosa TaxID=1240361 RepID=A0A8T2B1V3_9BRAS|nr:WD40 repeat [Arabidopsis thaliana x Arabidopsis arenosa]